MVTLLRGLVLTGSNSLLQRRSTYGESLQKFKSSKAIFQLGLKHRPVTWCQVLPTGQTIRNPHYRCIRTRTPFQACIFTRTRYHSERTRSHEMDVQHAKREESRFGDPLLLWVSLLTNPSVMKQNHSARNAQYIFQTS